MISFSKFVTEALNKPYPINWIIKNKSAWIADVKLDGKSNHSMKIGIQKTESGSWNIMFTVDGKTEKTGMGEQFRVFATVKKAIEDWWKYASQNLDHVKSISFSADKSRDESRTRLYKRFANQFAKETGFTLGVIPDNSYDTFILKNMKK
jgi:hypothetical protein